MATVELESVNSDITILPPDHFNEFKLEWVINGVMPVVLNDSAICRITLENYDEPVADVNFLDIPSSNDVSRIPKYWELYTDISNRFKLLDL